VADEEDIALSAFNSLCLGGRRGRFPDLRDRDSLWGLLVFITAQKAADWVVHERRQKRGGGKVHGHSALIGKDRGTGEGSFDDIIGRSPGPETLQVWTEEYEHLLDRLGDERLRHIAELSMQGYKIDEIAGELGLSRQAIHRKLHIIRKIWLAEKRA
jgi:hypothetical protein